MKRHYDKIILREIIHALDDGRSIYVLNILQRIQTFVMAWNNVSQETISNCFKKAKFLNNQNVENIAETETIKEEIN